MSLPPPEAPVAQTAAATAPPPPGGPQQALRFPEFIALVALLFSTVAFSIDAMLPALPDIAAELSPGLPNAAQLIVTSFLLGLGMGTLVAGPLSDALGRRPVILGGIALYLAGSVAAIIAGSLELLLLARFVQGLGGAGPRTVTIALMRDLYAGRMMARIMSIVMTVFLMVPALAPWMGQIIINLAGWRWVFGSFLVFGALSFLWFGLRQPETHPAERRRALTSASFLAAGHEVLSHPVVLRYTLVLTLGFAQMFAFLASSQQIFDISFARREEFPFWFAMMALVTIFATFLNAALVVRVGMRPLARIAYGGQSLLSLTVACLFGFGLVQGETAFVVFFIWGSSIFFMSGLTFGNLNALAMEPMGHLAGMAAAFIGAASTMAAVVIAIPIGLAFDGTPLPVMIGAAVCSSLALSLMWRAPRVGPRPQP
ncbi:MAG: multidrug effflux MFS transporter [Rhodobacteraceae bacterium]|nr:multidrug effflux MFS transporter [Paracoccaceae bacterium]